MTDASLARTRDDGTGKSLLALGAFVAAALAAGLIGRMLQGDGTGSWYESLDKPFYNPPSWVFGPVWTVLYVLIGVAAWFDWRRRERDRAQVALVLFGVQLVLNAAWTGIFFGLQEPGWALAEILVLLATIIGWIVVTWKPSRTAALLLLPYAAWVAYATAINAGIVYLD